MMILQRLDIATAQVTEVKELETQYFGISVKMEVVQKAICEDLAVSECNLFLFAGVEPFCKVPEKTVASYVVTEADGQKIDIPWAYIVTYE